MAKIPVSPMGQINGALAIMAGSDLGLVTADFTMANNATKLLTAIQTPVPLVVRVLVKLSAGALTVNIDQASTGTYASADATITASDTAEHVLTVTSTTANPFVNIQLVAGASGCTITELGVEAIGKLPDGHDWGSVRSAFNAFSDFRSMAASPAGGAFTLGNAD